MTDPRASGDSSAASSADAEAVRRLIGREPHAGFRVAVRCPFGAPAVIDDGTLANAVDATVTPEAAIYTSAGRAYRGRIDNLYLDVGRARRAATVHDVREALDALSRGLPVKVTQTEPIGCSIERR